MTLLEQTTLANGLLLSFYDDSRPLAGDRWRVELRGEVVCPLPEQMPAETEEPDPELRAAILARLGDKLQFQVRRTRNFVDQCEKEAVLAELLVAVKEHLVCYFAAAAFPDRLLQDTWRRLREECLYENRCRQLAGPDADEEEGPADFSALFRPDRLELDKTG